MHKIIKFIYFFYNNLFLIISLMKRIKNIFKRFDYFGVPFSFRYQSEDKYSTSLGGFFFSAFCIFAVIVVIYYFIPFFNRKNFSIVYYTMHLPSTDDINLKASKAAFAIGLTCDVGKDGTKVEDLLNLEFEHINYRKEKHGIKNKTRITLSVHPCNNSDFYYYYNESLDRVNMSKYLCLDKTDDIIGGIYTDEVFRYYEFTVSSKEDSESHYNKIDKFLISNDCKLQLYYTDIIIDLDNYEEPIKGFLNEIFIQINPTLFLKRNVFFVNQYFENDNSLLSMGNREEPILKTSFSRIEDYALYKGLNRYVTKPTEYQYYAKLYVRADTKKTIIKRKYQKLMEFFADSSSLLKTLFAILFIIFNYINNFYAINSFTKELFFFKDIEGNTLDINKRNKQIKKLINLTEPLNDEILQNSPLLNESKVISKPLTEETEREKPYENKEIKKYNDYLDNKIGIKEKELTNEIKLENEIEMKTKTIKIKKNKKIKIDTKLKDKEKEEYKSNIQSLQINPSRNDVLSGTRLNLKSSYIGPKNTTPKCTKKENKNEEPNIRKINLSFNIFEIITSSFFSCCMSNELKLKKDLSEKANNILYNKLDIVLFVKNMFLLDIMNKTLINSNSNSIIKFLSKPIISINKKEENQMSEFYKNYCEADFDNFNSEVSQLIRKTEKKEGDKKLLSLSNRQLKELIYN